jgi:hypothetical protein
VRDFSLLWALAQALFPLSPLGDATCGSRNNLGDGSVKKNIKQRCFLKKTPSLGGCACDALGGSNLMVSFCASEKGVSLQCEISRLAANLTIFY